MLNFCVSDYVDDVSLEFSVQFLVFWVERKVLDFD